MAKFFRRIREKLLQENKFFNYLLYAIGEIVLVVIGILIAVQINNWNTTQQQTATEKIYLQSLKEEFEYNLNLLNSDLEKNNVLIKNIKQLASLFDPSILDTTTESELAQLMSPLGAEVIYNPSRGVLTEIVSSGNLRMLKNSMLRQEIASFGNTLDLIKHQEGEVLRVRNKLEEHYCKYGNYRRFLKQVGITTNNVQSKYDNVGNKAIFNSPEFENRLLLLQVTTEATSNFFYLKLKKDIEEILDVIMDELKKHND